MEIILLERIESLGQIGDVVKVKAGYARNFLLPMKKALRATEANKKYFETQRKAIEERNLKAKADAEKAAKKIAGAKVVLLRQAGDGGQLYGSVTSRDIAAELKKIGHEVSRDQVELHAPIKETGMFEVTVRLHGDVALKLSINVARTDDEALSQEEAAQKALELFESEEAAKEAEKRLSDEKAKADAAPEAEESAKPADEKAPETKDAKAPKKVAKAEAKDGESKPAKKADAKAKKEKTK